MKCGSWVSAAISAAPSTPARAMIASRSLGVIVAAGKAMQSATSSPRGGIADRDRDGARRRAPPRHGIRRSPRGESRREPRQQFVDVLRRGLRRRREAGRDRASRTSSSDSRASNARPVLEAKAVEAVADRGDDAQRVAAGMVGDADDVGAAPHADIAGMADLARDPPDDGVGAVDQRRRETIELADLVQQQGGPIALALADRLQKPGIAHRAQQARGVALGHVQQRDEIRHRHVVARAGKAPKHVGSAGQDGHDGTIVPLNGTSVADNEIVNKNPLLVKLRFFRDARSRRFAGEIGAARWGMNAAERRMPKSSRWIAGPSAYFDTTR